MKVIKKMVVKGTLNRTKVTVHFKEDRQARHEFILNYIGYGQTRDIFLVDKDHVNGLEIHEITSNGIINVYNLNSKKWVTMMIARPSQIERYYDAVGGVAPKDIIAKAITHQRNGWNYI
jgi:hypothetical protein